MELQKMWTDPKRVLEAALALPAVDRAALVDSLLASLDRPDMSIDESWAVEAEERLVAFEAGRMAAIPFEDVFREFES
jgi:putative addiction module component (TIGR02574 family)